MGISDMFSANEIVRLTGKVRYGYPVTLYDVTVTNKYIYLFNDYADNSIMTVLDLAFIECLYLNKSGESYMITIRSAGAGSCVDLKFQRKDIAAQWFYSIKKCINEAKTTIR